MTKAAAQARATPRAERPRKWGNRRPAGKRLDLTPEEAARRAAAREAKLRSSALHVQVTAAERATIESRAKAYGMRKSDFVRTVLLSGLKEPPPARTDPDAVRLLAFELSKLGTNINQLAKRANEAARLGGDKEFEAFSAMETGLRSLTAQIAGTLLKVTEL